MRIERTSIKTKKYTTDYQLITEKVYKKVQRHLFIYTFFYTFAAQKKKKINTMRLQTGRLRKRVRDAEREGVRGGVEGRKVADIEGESDQQRGDR